MAVNPRTRRRRSNARSPWPAARPTPSADPGPARRRRPARPDGRRADAPEVAGPVGSLEAVLDRFTASWERGESPQAERFAGLLAPGDEAELVYHEFCLAEESGLAPDPAEYLRRFPDHAGSLGRLFALHGAVSASSLRRWVGPADLPGAGDEIGPYRLTRELGRGAFARVFLAEQSDLGDRLVVVKVSARATAEPTLLARARHAHIVEVLRQAEADDGALHLVCMPFLGGATLAAVLDARRKLGRRARSGRDLLADLDRTSAPEYPAPGLSRPAREVLAGLSHAGALAWIVARLAEALGHAHRRGVTHGDLKPANILLTAEATPMLLDFNLAVDWHEPGAASAPADSGGTLAYMAPERLRAVAGEPGDGDGDRADPGGRPARHPDRHRADLYSLGLVLLEALTGRPPEVPRRRPGGARELAAALAGLRRGLPATLRGRRAGAIPPALRPILARCLAPDPADRYARGDELAEDLDRWRDGRPPAFAAAPRRFGLSRRDGRRRAPLIAAATTLVLAAVAGFFASTAIEGTGRDRALAKLSGYLDRADSGVFSFRKPGRWRGEEKGDPAEVAARHLARYEAATDPDWRARADVRSLPDREREELEAWLLEQVLRRAVALGDRPDSPEDWRRAEALLARAAARAPLAALVDLRRTLRSRLQLPPAGPVPADAPRPPAWLDDYLAGVAAEPLHAREALDYYRSALRGRPDLLWAHYRAAAVACRIDEYPGAAEHLRRCVDRRPNNPALRVQLAALLLKVHRDTPQWLPRPPAGAALAECERALALDPDYAEAKATRAMILQASGQAESVEADLDRFAVLAKFRNPAETPMLRLKSRFYYGPNYRARSDAEKGLARQALDADPGNHEDRALLAAGLAFDGEPEDAVAEFDRVLRADPAHLRARYQRAAQVHRLDPRRAIAEYAAIIEEPRFEELFREEPLAIRAFHHVATALLLAGKLDEARAVAERALAHANRSGSFRDEVVFARQNATDPVAYSARGESHYLLARVHAVAARTDRDRLRPAVESLGRCFAIHEKFQKEWFAKDRLFDGVRDEIGERMGAGPADQ